MWDVLTLRREFEALLPFFSEEPQPRKDHRPWGNLREARMALRLQKPKIIFMSARLRVG